MCQRKKELEEGYIGACHKNLSFDFLKNFKIAVPKSIEFMNKCVKCISSPYDIYVQGKELLKKLELDVQHSITRLSQDTECDVMNLGDIIKVKTGKYIGIAEKLLCYTFSLNLYNS